MHPAIFKPKSSIYIFFVDHNPEYTSSLKRSIEHPELYSIETFTTGESYIEHIKKLSLAKRDIAIAFLGYQFFDEGDHTLMNGIEILEATKVINKNIEVIMLSGENETEYGSYVLKSGAHAFIPKDSNIFLRMNNIVMRLISEKRLQQKKHAFYVALRILIIYFLLMIVAGIFYFLLMKA